MFGHTPNLLGRRQTSYMAGGTLRLGGGFHAFSYRIKSVFLIVVGCTVKGV